MRTGIEYRDRFGRRWILRRRSNIDKATIFLGECLDMDPKSTSRRQWFSADGNWCIQTQIPGFREKSPESEFDLLTTV